MIIYILDSLYPSDASQLYLILHVNPPNHPADARIGLPLLAYDLCKRSPHHGRLCAGEEFLFIGHDDAQVLGAREYLDDLVERLGLEDRDAVVRRTRTALRGERVVDLRGEVELPDDGGGASESVDVRTRREEAHLLVLEKVLLDDLE